MEHIEYIIGSIKEKVLTWYVTEKEKLRPLTPKQRLSYIVTYYTSWFVGFLIACLFLSFIGDALIQSRKEIVLQGYIANDDLNYFPGSYMEKVYTEHLGLASHQRVVFDDSLYIDLEGNANEYTAASNGKVIATMAINELDFMISTRQILEHFKGELPMKDLEKFLPADILAAVEDQLVLGLDENGEEAMVGINMANSRYLQEYSPEVEYFLFIPYNIPHEEALLAFLRYCFC